jgi:hypothetical protein
MKPLSDAQKAEVRRKRAAYAKDRARTKADMLDATRAQEEKSWPDYMLPELTEDAWFHRKTSVSEFIEKRGGFSNHVVMLALTDSDWETKESVATWLRAELAGLREAEKKAGTAPVRRGKTLSRIEISDMAIELLESIGGESLVCLFQELLEVDRHRRTLAENFLQMERGAEVEATTLLKGQPLGVRSLAKLLSISASTVTRWRKSQSFRYRVQFHKTVWGDVLREDYFEAIRTTYPNATDAECYRRAFQMYAESVPRRRAGKAK